MPPLAPLVPAFVVLIAILSALTRERPVGSPLLLLAAGALISFVPGLPKPELDPELILVTLLPPILYATGVGMSWRGFRSNLRAILLLAVGCVVFTAAAVAYALNWLLAVPLAVGFVLGAIVSPPDAVAPTAVLRAVNIPRRIRVILEGEGLINDATALTALSFALAAVATGGFSLGQAAMKLLAIFVGELAFGCLIGSLLLRVRHLVKEPRAEILLALTTPYIAFWPPHALGGSGVVACVVAGLWTSWNGRRLIRPATRLQGFFIWDLVTFTVENAAFLLTGLQTSALTRAIATDGWAHSLTIAGITVVVILVVRFVWVFPATYLSRLIPAVQRADPAPNWRNPFFIAFSGVRGVVSMIAALSIPLTLAGRPFPERGSILLATFAVIVVTMGGIAPLIGPLIGWLGLRQAGDDEIAQDNDDERRVRREGIEAVIKELEAEGHGGCSHDEIEALKRRHHDRLDQLDAAAEAEDEACGRPVGELQLHLVDVERDVVAREYAENHLTDSARRRVERELDLEEARVRHAIESTGAPH